MKNILVVPIIQQEKSLTAIPFLPINHFNWGGNYRPKTYGQLAYLEHVGFVATFRCYESDPCHIYYHDLDPVYLEMNSNAAMLAGFGSKRTPRQSLTTTQLQCIQRKVTWNTAHNMWQAQIILPLSLILEYIPITAKKITSNLTFRFQLYKLAECSVQTHFISLGPIKNPEPNFHLPEYFLTGLLAY